MVKFSPIPMSDLDDIKQELYLAVHKKLVNYDSSRASVDTFISMVVNSAVKDLYRKYATHKRTCDRGCIPLNEAAISIESDAWVLPSR